MNRSVILLLFFIFSASTLSADVIRLQDGQIYLGNIAASDSSGFTLNTFGENRKIAHSDVLRTEKDLAALKIQSVEILLKDGSVILGKIQNYDEEIGILVDIDFGSITLPVQSVKEISDAAQKKYFEGYPMHLGIYGGYYSTLGSLSKDFGNNVNAGAFSEFKIPLMRGLYAGIDAWYYLLKNRNNTRLTYQMFTVGGYAMYRFYMFRSSSTFLSNLIPFVSAGTGLSYITINDGRNGVAQKDYREMDLQFFTGAGADYFITDRIMVRASMRFMMIPQQSASFNTAGAMLGAVYCL